MVEVRAISKSLGTNALKGAPYYIPFSLLSSHPL
jgi:hypothetical protein